MFLIHYVNNPQLKAEGDLVSLKNWYSYSYISVTKHCFPHYVFLFMYLLCLYLEYRMNIKWSGPHQYLPDQFPFDPYQPKVTPILHEADIKFYHFSHKWCVLLKTVSYYTI